MFGTTHSAAPILNLTSQLPSSRTHYALTCCTNLPSTCLFPICHFHYPTTRGSRLTATQGQGVVLRFHEEPCGINHKRIVNTNCDRIASVTGMGYSRWLSIISGRKYQPQGRSEDCPPARVENRSYRQVDLRIHVVSPAGFVFRLNGASHLMSGIKKSRRQS